MPRKLFHDTEQIEKDWWINLDGFYKSLLFWIEKKVSTAGIYDVNLIQFVQSYWKGSLSPKDFDIDEFVAQCNMDGKIRMMKIDGGRKLFYTTTIKFQEAAKGEAVVTLNPNSFKHKGILDQLREYKETREWLYMQIEEGKIRVGEKLKSDKAVRNEITPDVRRKILNRDNCTCQYCGKKDKPELMQIDHIVPVMKGGDNLNDNLVAICQDDNNRKRDQDPVKFIEDHGYAVTERLLSNLHSLANRGLLSLGSRDPLGIGIGIGIVNDTIKVKSSSKKTSSKKDKKVSPQPETRGRKLKRYTWDEVIAIHGRDTDSRKQQDFQITSETGPDGKKLWIEKKRIKN